jgi:hypothetical protein
MKSTLTPLLLLLALATSPSPSFSQDAEVPADPLINKAPDFSKWVIAYSYPEDKLKTTAATPPATAPVTKDKRLRQVAITKTKSLVREETTTIMGDTTIKFYASGIQYTKPPGSKDWFEATNVVEKNAYNAFYAKPLPPSGFRDLDWITAENYVGTIKYNGSSVLVFVPGGTKTLSAKDLAKQKNPLETQAKAALIDDATRFPVAVQEAGTNQTYKFDTPPTEMLTFPPDLEAALKKGKEDRAKIDQFAPTE